MKSLTFITKEECKIVIHGLEDGDYAALSEILGLVEIGGKLWYRGLVDELYAAVPAISARKVLEIADRHHARCFLMIMALGAVRNRAQYWVEKAKAYAARSGPGSASA